VREFTYNGIEHANHNHLMSRYEGMDGLKTGLTNASGFNLAASAIRNGRRLIGVVFGGASAAQRDDYMAELLDQSFQRESGIAMTTAQPPPVPGHKPDANGGQTRLAEALPPTPVLATPRLAEAALPNPGSAMSAPPEIGTRSNAARPAMIGATTAATGEGDIEAADDIRPAAKPAHGHAISAVSGWSIQIGAFASRQATEQAIRNAVLKAPALLQHAVAVVEPAASRRGAAVFRARLAGLEAAAARKACHLLPHCMAVPPGSS